MLTSERARDVFDYDHSTGHLTWRSKQGRSKIGERAGSVKTYKGKVLRRDVAVDGRSYREHRVIMLIVNGAWPDNEVDHINGNPVDNRFVNLRDVTSTENSRNTATRNTNTSGVMGVSLHKVSHKYHANIQYGGRKVYLGSFSDFNQAVAARKEAERNYGYHANHGR